jgi:hypothetical protein
MSHRYPLDAAPDPDARNVVEEMMGGVHRHHLSFPIVEEDEGAMLGWLGPMRYVPRFIKKAASLRPTLERAPRNVSFVDDH